MRWSVSLLPAHLIPNSDAISENLIIFQTKFVKNYYKMEGDTLWWSVSLLNANLIPNSDAICGNLIIFQTQFLKILIIYDLFNCSNSQVQLLRKNHFNEHF